MTGKVYVMFLSNV